MIDKLNYEEKIVLTLYYKDNYSCNEIANILNISVNTVKSRITRAKDKIKQTLKGGIYND
ncbi:RNA polymerase sigma factor [compost metagenome]